MGRPVMDCALLAMDVPLPPCPEPAHAFRRSLSGGVRGTHGALRMSARETDERERFSV